LCLIYKESKRKRINIKRRNITKEDIIYIKRII
jgi:hypothetical protein